jgi:capsular exopolysaccharide synthesis family protein
MRSSGGTAERGSHPSALLAGERFLRTTRRWAKVLVLGMLAGGIVAFSVSNIVAPEYRATAQLYLAPAANPTTSVQDVVAGQNLARSYVQLANASVVLRAAMDRVGWQDLKTFRDRASITQIRDTSIINVSFQHGDPQYAADASNAIAEAFIEQSRTLQSSLQGTAIQQLDEQIKSLQEDIRGLDSQIAGLPAGQQSQQLQLDGQRQTKQQTLAQLLKTRDDMRLASARAENTVSLWEPAVAPIEPDSPNIAMNTLLGIVIAGLLVVLVISLLSYFEDRVTDFDAMHEKLGITPLAEILASAQGDTFSNKLFVRDAPMSFEAEAFRGLRTSILFASVDRRPRTILVTSALPYEGKSVVSANLALAFAQSGSPTVLIDADLRRPSQHRLFGLDPSIGLTNLLTSSDPPPDLARFEVAPNLSVIPAGLVPPDPAEFLGSARMSTLLDMLASRAPNATVIIDTSPTLAVADAIALATKVDGCLIVVDSAHTRTASALRAVESLRRVRARIIGGALNKVRTAPAGYYGYGQDEPEDQRRRRPRRRFGLAAWLLVPLLAIAIAGTGAFLVRASQPETPTLPRSAEPASLSLARGELAAAREAWDKGTLDVVAARSDLANIEAHLARAAQQGATPRRVSEISQEANRLRAKVDDQSARTSLLVDMKQTYGASGPTQLVLSQNDIYALDAAGQKVWRVASDGSAVAVLEKGRSGVGAPQQLAAKGQRLFVLDDAGRIFKLEDDALSEVKLGQKRYRDPVAFDVFANNLYVLDRAAGQVWKYEPDSDGAYLDAIPFLATPLAPGTARSLAVDGQVWILTTDGQVLRYRRTLGSIYASRQPFEIRWTSDAARPTALQAREEDTALYLLDGRARRVVLVGRDGHELARIALSTDLALPAAFAVRDDVVISAHDSRLQRTLIPK